MVDIKEFSYELYLDVSELEGSFRALKEYAKGRYQEVVEIVDEILVKIDYIKDLISSLNPPPEALLKWLTNLHDRLELEKNRLCR
jgi:hypothetical protein